MQYSSYHKSSEIYEIWCYFKILEIFILRKDMSSIGYPGREKGKPFVFESWENQDYSKVVHAIKKKYIENREKRDSVKILEELGTSILPTGKMIFIWAIIVHFKGKKLQKQKWMKRSSPVQHRAAKTDIFLILNKEIFFACDASKELFKRSSWEYRPGTQIYSNVGPINIFTD